jgi:hypothetical protein
MINLVQRLTVVCVAVFAPWLTGEMFGADRCEVCGGQFLGDTIYTRMDEWTREQRSFCGDCQKITERCAVCQIPVKNKVTAVGDGRYLCERDASLVILDDAEAAELLREVRKELDRLLARFLVLPSTNIDFAFESQVRMHQILQWPGFERQCPSLLGTTRSLQFHDRGWHHEIRVLRALPRSEMVAVYVHELGHAWIREHVPPTRRITRQAVEGFCELLAYRYLEHAGETDQLGRLQRNGYTEGQIDLFLRVYSAYDLNPILDWMKYGEDPYLQEADLDRVRYVNMPAPRPVVTPRSFPVWRGPVPAPEQLTLTGIMGGASRRVAVVNGATLVVGEKASVPLGTNNLQVLCRAIGTNHVTLELADTGEELVLEWRRGPAQ